jgi:hypothetical protein
VAEHNINLENSNKLDRIIREAIEIELHLNNMKREDGFYLSKSWKSLTFNRKERRMPA